VLGNKAAEDARLGAPEPHGMSMSSHRSSEKLPHGVAAGDSEFEVSVAAACVFGERQWEGTDATVMEGAIDGGSSLTKVTAMKDKSILGRSDLMSPYGRHEALEGTECM
jgi:hypothetical protein